MLDLLRSPWPWWVAGPLIGLVVPFMYWFGGRKWGISSALQHLCAAVLPAGIPLFTYDWRRRGGWQLAMAAGIVVGGYLGGRVLADPAGAVALSAAARTDLAALGLTDLGGVVPRELFGLDRLASLPGLVLVVGGGFLVGFGARWANGCTSGHAISGLANLQPSSLLAVLGFFAGGLVSAHLLLPLLLG